MQRSAIAVIAMLLLALGTPCLAAHPSKPVQSTRLSDLSSSLSALRDSCASQAEAAKSAYSAAIFQNSLDGQLAIQQAQMDAQVYGVGHGRRETTEYLEEQLQSRQADVDAARQNISEKLSADAAQIAECVTQAEQTGKDKYSAYKAGHKHKADLSDAESLMTVWLTNLKEISPDLPQGSDATVAAWKTAKSHAEVADL